MVKVSVIVPVYKVEPYMERCARFLFEQTLKDVEYIFVDDCTPDNSMMVLEKVLKEYPSRVGQTHIVRHSENRGLPSARNSGLALATGEYIIHCDSDDWVEKDMYEKMYEHAKETDADIVGCDFYEEYENSRKYVKQDFELPHEEYLTNLLRGVKSVGGYVWCRMVKREMYEKNAIRCPDGLGMLEDLVLTVKLHHFAHVVAYCSQAFYHYNRLNVNSLVINATLSQLESMINATSEIENFLKQERIYTKYHLAFMERAFLCKANMVFLPYLRNYQRWRILWPEANKYIWKYHISFINKLIFSFAKYRLYVLTNILQSLKSFFSSLIRYNLFWKY